MAGSSNNNNYLVQGSILAVSSILSRFIGMLYRVPLTNIIGDTGMGYYSSAYELYNLALILSSYSIPVAVSKLVSNMESKKQYRNAYQVFRTALVIAAGVGAIASLAVYLLAESWAKLVRSMPVAIPLRVLAPTIFVFSVMGVLRGYFQGKRTMVPTAVSQLFEQIINAIVSVAAAYRLMDLHNASVDVEAYGAAGGTFGSFAGAVASFLFLLWIYRLNRSYIHRKNAKDKFGLTESTSGIVRLFLMTVVPIILSQTVYQLSGVIDNAVFGQVMDWQDKGENTSFWWGIYANKYRMLTNLPVAVATALGTSIVPALAGTYTKGDDDGVREKIGASVKFNMLLAIPCAAGLAVLAKPIIQLLFHSTEIEQSAKLLQLGAAAVIFFAYSTLTNGILQGIDRMRLPVKHAAISLVLHVIILLLLLGVFRMDVYGLVIGNVLYAFCVCILNWRAIAYWADYRQERMRTFVLPLLCSVIMGAVAYLVYEGCFALLKSNLAAVLMSMVTAVLCYGILLILTRTVNKEELLSYPGGRTLVRVLKKSRLLK